jgi:hypothetical protein
VSALSVLSEKISLAAGNQFHVSAFMNSDSDAPAFCFEGDYDLTQLDYLYLNLFSQSDKPFIMAAKLTDAEGGTFTVGYEVVKPGRNVVAIHLNPVMQRRLNDTVSIENRLLYKENIAKRDAFLFGNVRRVVFYCQNYVKLLDENRERFTADYDFKLTDAYYTNFSAPQHIDWRPKNK